MGREEVGEMHRLHHGHGSRDTFVHLDIYSLHSPIFPSVHPSIPDFLPTHTHTLFTPAMVWTSQVIISPLTPSLPLCLAFQHKTPDIMWQVSAPFHTVSPEA